MKCPTILTALARLAGRRLPRKSAPRPCLEGLEDRLVPAGIPGGAMAPPPVFSIANGDTAGLIAAIQSADASAQPATINLADGVSGGRRASRIWPGSRGKTHAGVEAPPRTPPPTEVPL
jgi:hypothetical protein